MLGHSVTYYLPSFWATTPFYSEKLVPLLDTYLSVGSPHANKLALAYYDLWNKYTKPEDMQDDSIREYIKDLGYGYLLNLLNNSSESLRELLMLLPIIAMLKDSRKGLELVFSLFKADESTISIKEWWEGDELGDEDTFEIDCAIDISNISESFLQDFGVFIQKYVHPTLTCMKTMYTISGGFTLLPVLTVFNTVDLKRRDDLDD